MIEENRRQAEKVRHVLGEFLDRLAKAVIDGLGRSKRVVNPTRGHKVRPPGGRKKTS